MASPLMNPAVWAFTQVKVLVWLLTLVRMTGLLASMPGFGQTRVPLLIRVALVVLFALVLAPVVPAPQVLPNGIYQLAGIIVNELAAGVLMGLCVALVIDVVAFAGQLMDTQMGYAFVSFLDPVSAHPASVSAKSGYEQDVSFSTTHGLRCQIK